MDMRLPDQRRHDPAPPVRDVRRPVPAYEPTPAPAPVGRAGLSRRNLVSGAAGLGLLWAIGFALAPPSPSPPPAGPTVIAAYTLPLPMVVIATEAERERALATWPPLGPEAAARLARDSAAGLVSWYELTLVDDQVEDGDQVAVVGPYTAATVTIRHAPTRLVVPLPASELVTVSYVWTPDRIATMAISTQGGPIRPAPLRPGQAFTITPR